jgi:hypothetical protein
MVDVTDGADVYVRLCALKFCSSHVLFVFSVFLFSRTVDCT